ncbi:MAG: SDR family oxidoreductase [Litoreibacter sp.]
MISGAALVTGAGGRLGRALAIHLAEMGFDVAIHYANSSEGAEETARIVRERGCRAVTLQADLLDFDAAEALVGRAVAELGQLTVLVNSASIFEHDTLQTATRESWTRSINSNLYAPFILTQAFAAQAPKAGLDDASEPIAKACVVNMIDQRVRKLTPDFSSYTIAKMGLWAFTQTAAMGLAPDIRVNAIGPGPTLRGGRQTDEDFAKQRQATILERGSNPEEIVRTLEFLIRNPALTGQLICVDGGQHLAWQTPDILGVE